MNALERERRLADISTMWTVLLQAGGGTQETATPAQAMLVQRYYGAVHQYLLGALRDEGEAAELTQEFVLRFLQGRFRHADPGRGRFRDYLKTALIHMINDYRKEQRGSPRSYSGEPIAEPNHSDPSSDDDSFRRAWREELLDRTWNRLATDQPTYYAVLKYRVENPGTTSAEMAESLSARLKTPLSPAGVRKALQRAHQRFARLLVDEVTLSLCDEESTVEMELAELDLLKFCRSALR